MNNISNIPNISKIILLIFTTSLFVSNAHSHIDDKIIVNYQYPFEVEISTNAINHVNFGTKIISKIWGNNTQYDAQISNSGHDLFITARVKDGENIMLSLSMADGKIIDMLFSVKDGDMGRIVNIDLDDDKTNIIERSEIQQMLFAMQFNKKGKYYVKNSRRKFHLDDNLIAEQSKIYRFENLRGAVMKVKNTNRNRNKEPYHLSKEKIGKFFNEVRAVQIGKDILSRNETTQLFVVFEKTNR